MNSHTAASRRLQTLAAALSLVLLTLVTFAPALRAGFVAFDDDQNVYANSYLNPVTAHTLPRFWRAPFFELYTPVTDTIWAAAALARGSDGAPNPAAFHALGIAFHAANVLLVFALLCRLPLLRERSPVYAALGAAVFAVHPLQAESVAWVTGNNNVFAGFFALLALLIFARGGEDVPRAAAWHAAAAIAFALALLAKPTVAALPLAALCLSVLVYRVPARRLAAPLAIWCLIAAALLLVSARAASPVRDVSLPFWQRPFIAGDALAFYAAKLTFPVSLGIDYGRKPEWLRAQAWFYAAWLIPLALGGLLFLRRDRTEAARYYLAGFAVFAAATAPMLGLVVFYVHRYSTVTDRYVYLSLLGVSIAVAVGLSRLPRLAVYAAAIAVLVLAALCRAQTGVWHDSKSLFANAVRVNGRSMLGYGGLYHVYANRGDRPAAVLAAQHAVQCPPEGEDLAAAAWGRLSDLLAEEGRNKEAIAAMRRAVAAEPTSAPWYGRLAARLSAAGDAAGAREAVAKGIAATSDAEAAAYEIGAACLHRNAPEIGVPLLTRIAAGSGANAANAARMLQAWRIRN